MVGARNVPTARNTAPLRRWHVTRSPYDEGKKRGVSSRAATAFEKYQKLARIFCLKPAVNGGGVRGEINSQPTHENPQTAS